jgi:hypothetical protein
MGDVGEAVAQCSSTNPAACTPAPVGNVSAPPPPIVTIKLSSPVACPGHPLQIDAIGLPGGGSYEWHVTGAQLVDGSGNPTTTGATVFLRGYQTDNSNGSIPAQNTGVGVVYTCPQGKAEDRKTVPIHKIDFVVTNDAVTAGQVTAVEDRSGVTIYNDVRAGAADISTSPKVQIKIDPSCPRKDDCAKNHRVGWLQTMLTNDRRIRYNDTLVSVTCPMPIRDVWDPDGLRPFYQNLYVKPFAGDGDTQTAHHEDSPKMVCPWYDPRASASWIGPRAPATSKLFQVFYANSFTAWLVVQNVEWSAHDNAGSYVYLRNFNWSAQLNIAVVDLTQDVGHICTPSYNPVHVDPVQKGKGGSSPVLTAPFFNTTQTASADAAPNVK